MWKEMLGSGFNLVFILSRRDGSRPVKVPMFGVTRYSKQLNIYVFGHKLFSTWPYDAQVHLISCVMKHARMVRL